MFRKRHTPIGVLAAGRREEAGLSRRARTHIVGTLLIGNES